MRRGGGGGEMECGRIRATSLRESERIAKASSSHARSRRSSPAAVDDEDLVDEKAEKEEDVEEPAPEELAVKTADANVVEPASQLLLDSVSETADAAADARVRVSCPSDPPASESVIAEEEEEERGRRGSGGGERAESAGEA